MDVIKNKFGRSELFAALPRKVDYEQWFDPDSSEKSKAHFKSLLDTFYESMLEYVDGRDFSALEYQVNNDNTFNAPYIIEGAGMAFGILFHTRFITVNVLENSYFNIASINRLFSFGVGMSIGFLGQPFEKCLGFRERLSFRAIKDGYGFYSGIRFRHRLQRHGHALINDGPSDFGLWSGYGRSLWFASSSQPEKLFNILQTLPLRSRGAVWRGVGLAATFTGGAELDVITELSDFCTEHRHHLSHGAQYGLYLRGKAHENFPSIQKTKTILCKPLDYNNSFHKNITTASSYLR
ncbi:DUF1702 family protein [Pseudoalteromonas sp. OF7H-1]|uniref:DUF1702 family protein n=1 Tax=Pseudoalteromonas sp. OF7H-1 TaxID=2917755 RepID=UPI001EF73232|nr:DUF1702 family protein [Pseudoalteromonas sp. OF7H-1]MCG7539019.1 DUF1702 family protein [Pseudoalteromonas sp. OF7H-1]